MPFHRHRLRVLGLVPLVVGSAAAPLRGVVAQAAGAELRGLWQAARRFGPEISGSLLILGTPDGWRADIAGFEVPVAWRGDTLAFELPDGKGSFRGRRSGSDLLGHWIQPRTQYSGLTYATPVTLRPDEARPDRWLGTVAPLDDRFTFYLPVTEAPDGTLHAWLRNPERNQGRFTRVSAVERDGVEVRLVGRDTIRGRVEDGVITLPLRGGTYDFTPVRDSGSSPFFPRGSPPPRYRYRPPIAGDDGWAVGSVEEVGISRGAIERFVQMVIDLPMDSLGAHQLHGLLIARHGRLVVEEYFHGHHRALPHEMRSAAKSWTATLIGAAMQAGIPIRMDTPVYGTMLDSAPGALDPRKRAMTLAHLMAMTAGYNCDPDDSTSANEDVMDQRGVRDWYRHTLDVPLVSAPGEKVAYCSTEPNLAGGMLERVARESQVDLFDRLVARPLQMGRYHLVLQRTGEAYGGGGHLFAPRDFLKLAQLLLDGGRWQGRQVLPADWLDRIAGSLRDLSATQRYSHLWNSVEYPHGNGKVRAYFAGGNGGQIFMAIPELDLAIGFTGGDYAAAGTFTAQRVYVPRYLLPAVE